MEELILVNAMDEPIGKMEKVEAHRLGKLHRAFSVFIFNSKGELLLQQRAMSKYHSAGLWTNTCCGHPRPAEETKDAALRRLNEESGIKTELDHLFTFSYRAEFENGLTENEIDHVFSGISDILPKPNPEEAEEWKFASLIQIETEIKAHPEKYTAWFRICLNRLTATKL